ncbi:MAG: hypothetical protein COA96_13095 [SAR86 cluster bacterium]|uniref:N-terminal domain-containing protein n=1 Tax=SAR86 cluster bacterium TaxID=2030880 RepID=A0A2A5AUT2_9GAMM|nr:MAG: hypothetical protein COA96_13095 [SAR86 cluster bacterium]
MKNDSTKNHRQANAKTSLRGEAPRKHGGKSKKQTRGDMARGELIEKSQEAKALIELLLTTTGEILGINEMLVRMHSDSTGCKEFKTFHDWKKVGFRVIKGESAYRIWAKPIKAKAANESNTKEDEDASQYKFWPMCCLFNESQVISINTENKEEAALC